MITLCEDDEIQLGMSTRRYRVKFDKRSTVSALELERRKLMEEVKIGEQGDEVYYVINA